MLRFVSAYFAEKGIETVAPDLFLPNRKMPFGIVHNGTSADQGAITLKRMRILLTVFRFYSPRLTRCWPTVIVQNGRNCN